MKNSDKHPALFRLGQNIRGFRELKGFSQEELAFEAGLDRSYMGGVERGERNLTVLSLLKITTPLDVDLCAVVKGLANT